MTSSGGCAVTLICLAAGSGGAAAKLTCLAAFGADVEGVWAAVALVLLIGAGSCARLNSLNGGGR